MSPGRKPKKGQLGLFKKPDKTSKTFKKTKPVRKRLSPETVACRQLAERLYKRGLICATLMNRINGKRINVINIIGKEIETLTRTPGFDGKKFVSELDKEHIQNPENMRKFIAECWPYKKSSEEIARVQNAINVITTLILDSADARGWQKRFIDVPGKQLNSAFKRKISKE